LKGPRLADDLRAASRDPDAVVRAHAAALAPDDSVRAGIVGNARPFTFYLDVAREEADPAPRTLVLETDRGRLAVDLLPSVAPLTVHHLTRLAEAGFFDGLTFHRVVPDFVAQGGDPRGDGWGGPGDAIRCEISDLSFERGTAGMALSGKDTGGSQFFFTLSPQPHLDGGYTIFGRVEPDDLDVMDAIRRFDVIRSARVVRGAEPARVASR
jgi:cyclophilin family peptidyl-prolyl cis-trans isomerase